VKCAINRHADGLPDIAAPSLIAALAMCGNRRWPEASHGRVFTAVVAISVGYTIYSGWLNTNMPTGWAYSNLMPVIPVTMGTARLAASTAVTAALE